jgi:hypothetical protein
MLFRLLVQDCNESRCVDNHRGNVAARANSIRRRIASEREGLSPCCLAEVSMAAQSAGESRIADTGHWPRGIR